MNMTNRLIVISSLVVLHLAGCSPTKKGTPYQIKRIALLDVQGLSGGQNIYIDSRGHGWREIVNPGKTGLETVRFEFVTTKGTLDEFAELVRKHDFFDIKTKDRPGIPDEAHPVIYIETLDGRSVYIRKWANDKNANFDPIYEELLRWAEENRKKVGSKDEPRPFDGKWRPGGFKDVNP